jgi:hypothetical protein
LNWALDVGPVVKDRLRYLSDFSFATLSFSAFFILQAVRAFGPVITHATHYLQIVSDAAKLMIDLSKDAHQPSAEYGRAILKELEVVKEGLGMLADNPEGRMNKGSLGGEATTVFVREKVTDFASLFPDIISN